MHLNLVFNFRVREPRREVGLVDVVWGADGPYPRQVFNQLYTPFERDGTYGPHYEPSLKWWKRYHPDWIEYRAIALPSRWSSEAFTTYRSTDPAFLKCQRTQGVDLALRAGYGHFSKPGTWVAQYSGQYVDPAHRRDVIAWAHSTYAYVHAASPKATMAINFSYDAALRSIKISA